MNTKLNDAKLRFNKRSWFYRMKIHWKVELWTLHHLGFFKWITHIKLSDFNPKHRTSTK